MALNRYDDVVWLEAVLFCVYKMTERSEHNEVIVMWSFQSALITLGYYHELQLKPVKTTKGLLQIKLIFLN